MVDNLITFDEYKAQYEERVDRARKRAERRRYNPIEEPSLEDFLSQIGDVQKLLQSEKSVNVGDVAYLPAWEFVLLRGGIEYVEDGEKSRQEKNVDIVNTCLSDGLFFKDNYGIALIGREDGLFERVDAELRGNDFVNDNFYVDENVVENPSSSLGDYGRGKTVERAYTLKNKFVEAKRSGEWDSMTPQDRERVLSETDLQGQVTVRVMNYEQLPDNVVVLSCHGDPLGISRVAQLFGNYATEKDLGVHFDAYIKLAAEWAGVLHLPTESS